MTQPRTSSTTHQLDATTEHRASDFGGLRIEWDSRVLEPRSWTIAQPQWLADLAAEAPEGPALELCSGAGHMGLLLARLTGRRLVQVDASPVAVDYARANAEAAGIEADVRSAPMTEALDPDELFALVLADPPWVPSRRVADFPEDPLIAIHGGDDGLDLARDCLRITETHLGAGGHAVLQLGTEEQVERLWHAHGSQRLDLLEVRRHKGGVLAHLRA